MAEDTEARSSGGSASQRLRFARIVAASRRFGPLVVQSALTDSAWVVRDLETVVAGKRASRTLRSKRRRAKCHRRLGRIVAYLERARNPTLLDYSREVLLGSFARIARDSYHLKCRESFQVRFLYHRKQEYFNICPNVTLKTSPPPATAILTSDSQQGCQSSSDPQGPLLSSKIQIGFQGRSPWLGFQFTSSSIVLDRTPGRLIGLTNGLGYTGVI